MPHITANERGMSGHENAGGETRARQAATPASAKIPTWKTVIGQYPGIQIVRMAKKKSAAKGISIRNILPYVSGARIPQTNATSPLMEMEETADLHSVKGIFAMPR